VQPCDDDGADDDADDADDYGGGSACGITFAGGANARGRAFVQQSCTLPLFHPQTASKLRPW
jgi:hypothetical protein